LVTSREVYNTIAKAKKERLQDLSPIQGQGSHHGTSGPRAADGE
jgi:hypothetical protein